MACNFGFDADSTPGYYFVSYNTEDADRVKSICSHLNQAGLKIWYDGGIPHDSNWEGILAEKIDHCEEAVFFITKGIFEKAKGDAEAFSLSFVLLLLMRTKSNTY